MTENIPFGGMRDALYEGYDLEVAKKIKRTKSAILRVIHNLEESMKMATDIYRVINEQKADAYKAYSHMEDIDNHFRKDCISKKISSVLKEEDKE